MRLVNYYKNGKILMFCMIIVAKGAFCQHNIDKAVSDINMYNTKAAIRVNYKTNILSFAKQFSNQKKELINKEKDFYFNSISCSIIDADFYTQNFGFFCKKELQFEKITKIPLRFRLGSLQYNDYLEQKPNAVKPF